MTTREFVRVSAIVLSLSALFPAAARAQSAIAGAVKDTSGGVMPGVTVEAASPALIEKVRTVVTDEQGLFRILDLRPGTYTVTFTLTGFNTVRREVTMDIYNLLNRSNIQTLTTRLGSPALNNWQQPNVILQARFFQFGTQFDF